MKGEECAVCSDPFKVGESISNYVIAVSAEGTRTIPKHARCDTLKMELKENRTKILEEAKQLETQIVNARQQTAGLQDFIKRATLRMAHLKGRLELLDELIAEENEEK